MNSCLIFRPYLTELSFSALHRISLGRRCATLRAVSRRTLFVFRSEAFSLWNAPSSGLNFSALTVAPLVVARRNQVGEHIGVLSIVETE
jgi:hypothetical protein